MLDNYTGTLTAADVGLPATGTTARASITLLSSGQIELETLTGNIASTGFEVGTYGSGEYMIASESVALSACGYDL